MNVYTELFCINEKALKILKMAQACDVIQMV